MLMTDPVELPKQRRSRELRLKREYGITIEMYEQVLAHQNYSCAICKKPALIFKVRLAVDHDHKTGVIRGLLCMHCNRALGKWRDNDDQVKAAAVYVEQPPFTQVFGKPIVTAPHGVKTKIRKRRLKNIKEIVDNAKGTKSGKQTRVRRSNRRPVQFRRPTRALHRNANEGRGKGS